MWLGCKVWTRREDEWIGERKIKEHGNRCKLEHEVYDIPADEGWKPIGQRTPTKAHTGQSFASRKLLSSRSNSSRVALHSGVLTSADIVFTGSQICSYCRLINNGGTIIRNPKFWRFLEFAPAVHPLKIAALWPWQLCLLLYGTVLRNSYF